MSKGSSSVGSAELSQSCSFSEDRYHDVSDGIAHSSPFPLWHRCPMLHELCASSSLPPNAMLGVCPIEGTIWKDYEPRDMSVLAREFQVPLIAV